MESVASLLLAAMHLLLLFSVGHNMYGTINSSNPRRSTIVYASACLTSAGDRGDDVPLSGAA